jgi:methyltransferase family protein
VLIPEKLKKTIDDCLPGMHGWCSLEKAYAMAGIVLEAKPQVSVEIGVWGGKSFLAMALAHVELAHGHAYGIDPWAKDAALDGVQEKENLDWWAAQDYDGIYEGCMRAMFDHAPVDRWTIYRATSQRASGLFDAIDFLHVDGNHSEKASTGDIMAYLPKLVSGGYLLFDDVDWFSTKRAVSLVEERCETIRAAPSVPRVSAAWTLYRKR